MRRQSPMLRERGFPRRVAFGIVEDAEGHVGVAHIDYEENGLAHWLDSLSWVRCRHRFREVPGKGVFTAKAAL